MDEKLNSSCIVLLIISRRCRLLSSGTNVITGPPRVDTCVIDPSVEKFGLILKGYSTSV